jgi:Domain of unknown function (DUF4157)
MNWRSTAQTKTTSSFTPIQTGLLQRKCNSCGQHTIAGGECTNCQQKSSLQRKLSIGASNDPLELEADSPTDTLRERVADRVMRMPEPPIQRQMEPKENEEGMIQTKAISNSITPLQRYSTDRDQPSEVPPVVHEVLQSPGQFLDPATRALMEPLFGHDFSQVRVHTDKRASESARAVNALAYAVGRDVVFEEGQYSPHNSAGREIIAHELAHVVQQQFHPPTSSKLQIEGATSVAEREADQASQIVGKRSAVFQQPFTASLPQVARQTRPNSQSASPSVTSSPSPMTRAEFEVTVLQRFGVLTVRTGTLQEQEQQSMRRGAPTPPRIDPAAWHSWDPGSSSEIYRWIISSLENVSANFGGIPGVREIVFFEVEYEQDTTTGAVVARPQIGASYGAGVMTIYRSGISGQAAFPTQRSSTRTPQNRPTIVVQTPGSSPGADLPLPTPEQNAQRTITHELGHGLVETALTPPASGGTALDASMIDDYKRTVGWIGAAGSERLFDIGAQVVQTAIANGSSPPATFEITEAHWNDPRWVEQPMSGYMVAGGPSEDFPEAVSVYINAPAVLRARSPRRYEFLHSRKSRWQSGLRQPATAPPPSQQPGGNRPAPELRPPVPGRPRFGPLYEPRRDFNREILKSVEDL